MVSALARLAWCWQSGPSSTLFALLAGAIVQVKALADATASFMVHRR